jgi:hypothetical protein
MKSISIAEKYIGLKEDGGSNNLFKDGNPLKMLLSAAGQKEIIKHGRVEGEAYCSYFQEGVHVEAYPEKTEWLRRTWSANCVEHAKNLHKEGIIPVARPFVGALVIFAEYKDGKPTGKGHEALVILVAPEGQYVSIDGNTTAGGARETGSTGGIAKVNRKLGAFNPNGLNEIGFYDLNLE